MKIFSYQYRTLSGILRPFIGIFRAKVLKLHFTCQVTTLRKNIFSLKNLRFFNLFSDLEQKPFELLANLFRQGFQYCFLHVHSNFPRKSVFLRKSKFFEFPTLNDDIVALFLKCFFWDFENFMLNFQWNFLSKSFFPIFQYVSDIGRNIFRFFGSKVLTGLSQLGPTCRGELFE